jgi:hypothetical protein
MAPNLALVGDTALFDVARYRHRLKLTRAVRKFTSNSPPDGRKGYSVESSGGGHGMYSPALTGFPY